MKERERSARIACSSESCASCENGRCLHKKPELARVWEPHLLRCKTYQPRGNDLFNPRGKDVTP